MTSRTPVRKIRSESKRYGTTFFFLSVHPTSGISIKKDGRVIDDTQFIQRPFCASRLFAVSWSSFRLCRTNKCLRGLTHISRCARVRSSVTLQSTTVARCGNGLTGIGEHAMEPILSPLGTPGVAIWAWARSTWHRISSTFSVVSESRSAFLRRRCRALGNAQGLSVELTRVVQLCEKRSYFSTDRYMRRVAHFMEAEKVNTAAASSLHFHRQRIGGFRWKM